MYYNSDIEITKNGSIVKGKVKDLKEYFRYNIANLCTKDIKDFHDYEDLKEKIDKIIYVLDTLYYNDHNENDIVKVTGPLGGGLYIINIIEEVI